MSNIVPLRTSPVRDIIEFLESTEHQIDNMCVVLELSTGEYEGAFVLAATDGEFHMDSLCAAEEYFAYKRRQRVQDIIDFEEEEL